MIAYVRTGGDPGDARLLSHDAFHAGEISQPLGVHALPPIDLWARDRSRP